MVTLPDTAFLICLHLAAGSILVLPVAPIREFGVGLFRIVASLATLLMGAALYLLPLGVDAALQPEFGAVDTVALPLAYGPGAAAVFVLFFCLLAAYSLALFLDRLGLAAALLLASCLAALAAVIASAGPVREAMADGWHAFLVPVDFTVSALYQASGLVAMILGHRYLLPVRMPFGPFRAFAWIFLLACLARCLVVAASLAPLLWGPDAGLLLAMLGLDHPLGLFLWIRLAVGLGVAVVVAGMALHCVNLRANMAATGLLYIGMSMAIGGEIFARVLLLTTSILF